MCECVYRVNAFCSMKLFISFMFSLFFSLFQDINTTNVPDPCPIDLTDRLNVVTMCEENEAYEEPQTGSSTVDSVVVRINKHKDNCICKAGLQYYSQDSRPIYVQAYNQRSSTAPHSSSCGLHIEMKMLMVSGEQKLDVIKCNEAVSKRKVDLATNAFLELKTNKSNGQFDYGYCLQIFRVHNENQAGLQIQCYGQNTKDIVNKSSTIPTSPFSTTQGEDDITIYIAVGACVGGIFILLFVILLIIFIRKRVLYPSNKENNGYMSDYHASDAYNTYGLKDNVLYVPTYNNPELNHSDYDSRVKVHSNSTSDLLYHSMDAIQQEKGVKSQQQDGLFFIRDDGDYSTIDSNDGYKENNSATSSVMDTTNFGDYSTISSEKHDSDDLVNKRVILQKKPKFQSKGSCSNNEECVENDDVKGSNSNAVVYAVVNKGSSSVGLKH